MSRRRREEHHDRETIPRQRGTTASKKKITRKQKRSASAPRTRRAESSLRPKKKKRIVARSTRQQQQQRQQQGDDERRARKKSKPLNKAKKKMIERRRKRSTDLPAPPSPPLLPLPRRRRRRSKSQSRASRHFEHRRQDRANRSEGSDGTTWLHSDDDDDDDDDDDAEHSFGSSNIPSSSKFDDFSDMMPPPRSASSPISSPLQRVVSGQKKSAAIAQAATWEASRLREQVTAMETRFLSVSAQLKESMQREQSLKMGRGRDKLATKELRYRNLYLAKELAQVKDHAKNAAAKTRAKMHGMASSLNTLEESMAARSRGVQREVRHLRGLLTSLQRRAIKGTGPAGSTSGERILTAMWQAIETIYQIGVPGGSPVQSRVSSRRPFFTVEPDSSKLEQHGSKSKDNINSKEMTHDLADTMDGIVSDLERENQRLRAELEMLQTEILHHKGKSESIALIPQYRQAVIRAREHAELLRQRLRDEINARSRIQEELIQAQEEVRKLSARTATQARRTMDTEKELAVTNLRTAYVTQAMDSTQQQYHDTYTEFAATTMQQQQVIEELQDVVTSQRHQLEELSSGSQNVATARRTMMSTHHPLRQARAADVRSVPVTARRRNEEENDDLHVSSDSELFQESANDSGQMQEAIGGGGGGGGGDGDGGTNSLSVLHSDLATLDAEIAVLQRGIVEATKRQSGGSP